MKLKIGNVIIIDACFKIIKIKKYLLYFKGPLEYSKGYYNV